MSDYFGISLHVDVKKFRVDGQMALPERLGSRFIVVNFDKISSIGLINRNRALEVDVFFQYGHSISVVM